MKSLRLALLTAAVFSAAARAAAPSTTPVAPAEKLATDGDFASPEQRLATLTRENQRLTAELARSETTLRDVQAALTRQSQEIAANRAETAMVRIELAKAKGDLTAARGALSPPGNGGQSAPDVLTAFERERTAHIATKAILAQRENQVQDLIASRTKVESENRVLRASTDLAKDNAGKDTKSSFAQSAEFATKAAILTRDLNSARSEITVVRQELRNQTAKVATQADAHAAAIANLQQSLANARNELSQAKSSLTVTTQSNTATAATGTQAPQQLATATKELETLRTQFTSLQRELTAARAELTQTKAALAATARTPAGEVVRLREALAKAEATPKMSAADLAAVQIQERQLAALEQQLGQARAALDTAAQSAYANIAAKNESEAQVAKLNTEVTALQRDLAAATTTAQKQTVAYEAENARLVGVLARSNLSPAAPLAELEAAQRTASQAQRRLAAATEEIEALRAQVAAARPSEPEKVTTDANGREVVDKNEFVRVTTARAAAEDKLGIALRAYSLLARERDELRAQVEQLSAGRSARVDSARFAESTPGPSNVVTSPAPTADFTPTPVRLVTPERSTENARPAVSASPRPLPAPRAFTSTGQPAVMPGQPAFSHRISPGETLSSIAKRYYGNPKRWPEIVAANRDVLPDQSSFSAGKMIRIP